MFGKKKSNNTNENQNQVILNYTNWGNDFGFLVMIMDQNIDIYFNYNLKILTEQHEHDKSFISDKDITEDDYQNLLLDIRESLSDTYVKFMTTKYFNGEKALLDFISTYIRKSLIEKATASNNKKIVDNRKDEINKQIDLFNAINLANTSK